MVSRFTSSNVPSLGLKSPAMLHIWIIIGPAGCGKSTVAQYLAAALSLPYIEGDEFHPPANIRKMAAGIPLNDTDRWDWLIHLRQHALLQMSKGSSGVVVTCSALKRKYRDVMRIASEEHDHVSVHFVYLRADEETLIARVNARQGHYMKDTMVRSQFRTLEEPATDEYDCLVVDAKGTLQDVKRQAVEIAKQEIEKNSS